MEICAKGIMLIHRNAIIPQIPRTVISPNEHKYAIILTDLEPLASAFMAINWKLNFSAITAPFSQN